MEISVRRSMSLDLDRSVGHPVNLSHQATCENCYTNMYTMQAMNSSSKMKVQKPYRMESSLSVDSGLKSVAAPKRENFFTSMFGALSNMVMENFGKSLTSNMHNSLSVTVVPNGGIIPQDFFKNLIRNVDQMGPEQKDSIENSKLTNKVITRSMYDVVSPGLPIFAENSIKYPVSSKISLNPECNVITEKEMTEQKKIPLNPVTLTDQSEETDLTITLEESQRETPEAFNENESMSSLEMIQADEILSTSMEVEKIEPDTSTTPETTRPSDSPAEKRKIEEMANKSGETYCRGWQPLWRRVVNGVSERFGAPRASSPDSEVPAKRTNLGKPPRRKTCTIARGRGKGRGKSQLRRNGVSQSRHRRERTKQNIYSNIQDDLDAWEDGERCEGSEDEDDPSVNERSEERGSSSGLVSFDDRISPRHCSTLLESFVHGVASSMRKRKELGSRDSGSKCPMRVRYVIDSSMEIENDNSPYNAENCSSRLAGAARPRLISESSVDSEDSYCIVFENESDSENTDYSYDEISDETGDTPSDDDFEDDEKTTMTMKVRFNLEPQVHTMIKWDYAYRAARRGPWEEMARDRERFRGRIHCIERILNPILSVQHRNCVWQERFNVDENSSRTLPPFLTQSFA